MRVQDSKSGSQGRRGTGGKAARKLAQPAALLDPDSMGPPLTVSGSRFGLYTNHLSLIWLCLSFKLLLNATRIGSRKQWNYACKKIDIFLDDVTPHEQSIAREAAIAWFTAPGDRPSIVRDEDFLFLFDEGLVQFTEPLSSRGPIPLVRVLDAFPADTR